MSFPALNLVIKELLVIASNQLGRPGSWLPDNWPYQRFCTERDFREGLTFKNFIRSREVSASSQDIYFNRSPGEPAPNS